jgi:chemotaxis protein histidine kinase CheA
MEKLNIIKVIEEKGFNYLIYNLKLKIKIHSDFKNLVLLTFDKINSPKNNKVIWECRGLILELSKEIDLKKIKENELKKIINKKEKNENEKKNKKNKKNKKKKEQNEDEQNEQNEEPKQEKKKNKKGKKKKKNFSEDEKIQNKEQIPKNPKKKTNETKNPKNSKKSNDEKKKIENLNSQNEEKLKVKSVVSFPYTKFFNIFEENSVKIEELDYPIKIYEKFDGILTILYFFSDKWYVSTINSPTGNGKITINFLNNENEKNKNENIVNENEKNKNDENKKIENENEENKKEKKINKIRISELFFKIFKEKNYKLPEDKKKCYFFELLFKDYKIVVAHKKNNLILHGVRDLITLKEHDPKVIGELNGWEYVTQLNDKFKSINEVIDYSLTLNPVKNEGFVICSNSFQRIKIKNPQFLILNYINNKKNLNCIDKDELEEMVFKIVCINEEDEFLSYFPNINFVVDLN